MNAAQIEKLGEASSKRTLARLADTGNALATAVRSTHPLQAPDLARQLERLATSEWDRREAIAAGHVALAKKLAAKRDAARARALAYVTKTD